MATPKVLILMADYGHDPTGMASVQAVNPLYTDGMPSETAVPYTAFKKAGFDVQFATETGNSPKCDERMISGMTQKLLVSRVYLSEQGYERSDYGETGSHQENR